MENAELEKPFPICKIFKMFPILFFIFKNLFQK